MTRTVTQSGETPLFEYRKHSLESLRRLQPRPYPLLFQPQALKYEWHHWHLLAANLRSPQLQCRIEIEYCSKDRAQSLETQELRWVPFAQLDPSYLQSPNP